MRNSFLKGTLSSVSAAIGLTIASSLFASAEAASLTFDTNSQSSWGSPIISSITLDDQAAGAGKVQFTVQMAKDSPTIGDIRGFFFNISDDSLLSGLNIEGSHVTSTAFQAGSISKVGSANLNGDGGRHSFDIGVEIGENGLKGGTDDIQTTTFTLSHATRSLDLSFFTQQAFGVRLTSVGTGTNREGSSKLVATSPMPQVVIPPTQPENPPASEPDTPPAPEESVVIAPPPTPGPVPETQNQIEKPAEVPEPGTSAALALAAVGGFRFLKRKGNGQA